MDYFSNTGVNATSTQSTKPNFHDFQELVAIYDHVDGYSTVSGAASAANSANEVTDDPRSWGQWMREKSKGRSDFYERRNRDGSITITHVYWTEERAAKCDTCDHRDHNH